MAPLFTVLLFSLITLARADWTIYNGCNSNIYMNEITDVIHDETIIAPNTSYGTAFLYDVKSDGVTLAMTKEHLGAINQKPELNLQYNVDWSNTSDDWTLWYELNNLKGVPFDGQLVEVTGDDCPEIVWNDGKKPADGESVKTCGYDREISLLLCSEG